MSGEGLSLFGKRKRMRGGCECKKWVSEAVRGGGAYRM